jgi:glycosyltransferase involved in cell wall biosynthesis
MNRSVKTRPLVVVSDHPSLHRGFSTVGHQVATALQQSNIWDVTCLGRYRPGDIPRNLPYDVVALDPDETDEAGHADRLASALQTCLPLPPDGGTIPVVCVGHGNDQVQLADVLEATRLRDRVQLIGYTPVDYAPLPRRFGAVLGRLDIVVPFTDYAKQVMETWCQGANECADKIAAPIPHGVDLSVFHPRDTDTRRSVRRSVFDVGDDHLVVGFFGRNSGHKRPDLAIRIFHHFATGAYWICHDCEHITAYPFDPINARVTAVDRCGACNSSNGAAGDVRPRTRLYLHTELLTPAQRLLAGGWDLAGLIASLEIGNQVVLANGLATGKGLPVELLAQRMAACDLHLLPYDCGGWELTVLEAAACGVPNLVTDYASPPSYARPFAKCIPIATEVFEPGGFRGLIDIGRALESLRHLADDPGAAERLGEQGLRGAEKFAWERVGKQWQQLLAGGDG